jgi:hypothetical protein
MKVSQKKNMENYHKLHEFILCLHLPTVNLFCSFVQFRFDFHVVVSESL